jgi:hypothetical protein
MQVVQTRRRFLTTASMAGVVGLVGVPAVLAKEGSLETTAVRFEKSAALCTFAIPCCNRENVVDIVLSDRATSAQNIYE